MSPEVSPSFEPVSNDLKRRLAMVAAIAAGIFMTAVELDTQTDTASAASQRPILVHIEDNAHVSKDQKAAFKIAMVQESKKIGEAWGTPPIEFSNKGWPLKLESVTSNPDLSGNAVGYHGYYFNKKLHRNQPYMVAAVGVPGIAWQKIGSHELAESIVNPWANRVLGGLMAEVCDGVRLVPYNVSVTLPNGKTEEEPLANVNTPNAFTGGPPPYDLAGAETIPLNQPGGWQWGYGTTFPGGDEVGQFNKRGTTTAHVARATESNTPTQQNGQTIISYYPS